MMYLLFPHVNKLLHLLLGQNLEFGVFRQWSEGTRAWDIDTNMTFILMTVMYFGVTMYV